MIASWSSRVKHGAQWGAPSVGFWRGRVFLRVLCMAAAPGLTACDAGFALGIPEEVVSVPLANGAEQALVLEDGTGGALDWQRTLGDTGLSVTSAGAASDPSGNAFLTGRTNGALDGEAQGKGDAFVAAYSPEGRAAWTRQLGTSEVDAAASIITDGGGNVLVAGNTSGDLASEQQGFGDAFIAKYSADGVSIWTSQLGSNAPDGATGVSAAPGGAPFVVGFTRGALSAERTTTDADAFLASYSAAGELIYTRQLGSAPGYDDFAQAVSASTDGTVFVAGRTFGALAGEALGSADAFVAKYSADGALLWARQFGTEDFDAAEGVSADAGGNVYVSGQTGGFLAGGPGTVVGSHPFIAKYDSNGELLWEQQLDAATMGAATSVASDAQGSVFIAGYTSASFGGANLGAYDAFLAQFSEAGEQLWITQPGLADTDRASGVSTDGQGRALLAQTATRSDGDRLDYTLLTRFR
jgi:hypothetical protein